jgi:5-methylcytosine-specific restriction endonuclease McrA
MANFKFIPSTAGERLYRHIALEILDPGCSATLAQTQKFGSRANDFSQYFFGFACANIFSRLMKKAERVLDSERLDPTKVIYRYIRDTLEVGQDKSESIVKRTAALAVDAVHTSHKDFPNSVMKSVTQDRPRLSCYLCGNQVYKDATDESDRLEYEHIWPSSYGGDSSEANLLPACTICNRAKDDMVLWHTAPIAGFCLKPEPSVDEMTRVHRKHKIASYMRKVFDCASQHKMSLKTAALQLGPIDMAEQRSIDSDDARDFFNLHLE